MSIKLKNLVNGENEKERERIFYNETKNGFMHKMHRYSEIRMEHILTDRHIHQLCRTNKRKCRWKKTKKAKVITQNHSRAINLFKVIMLSIVLSLLLLRNLCLEIFHCMSLSSKPNQKKKLSIVISK